MFIYDRLMENGPEKNYRIHNFEVLFIIWDICKRYKQHCPVWTISKLQRVFY